MSYPSPPGARINDDNSITSLQPDINQSQPPVISQPGMMPAAFEDFFTNLEMVDKVIVKQKYEREEVETGKETANKYDVWLGQQCYFANEGIF